jgi:predicted permease
MFERVLSDLRYSVRRLRMSPGLAVVAVATLTLVIAADTTAYSLVRGILLRDIVAHEPERLFSISTIDTRSNQQSYVYFETFNDLRTQAQSIAALAMYSVRFLRVQSDTDASDVNVECVTPSYFMLMQPPLEIGRFLTEEDNDPAAPRAVITDRLWRRLFNGSPQVLGRTINIDAKPVTIVGVVAGGFVGLQFDGGADVFVPVSFLQTLGDKGRVRTAYMIGRLAKDVGLEEARTELKSRWSALRATLASSVAPAERETVASQEVVVESAHGGFSALRREFGPTLVVVMTLGVVILLVGCANLAGLMLARSVAREHEAIMMIALGAGRGSLWRQGVVEGVLLAFISLTLALPLAWWASGTTTAALTYARATPLVRPLTPDSHVLAVVGTVAMMTGVFIGIVPAWRVTRTSAAESIRSERTVARSLGRAGHTVLVGQVALSLMLLFSAGLFARTMAGLHANDAAFRDRGIVWTRLSRNPGDRGLLSQPYFETLIQRLSAISGVQSAALSTYFPAYLGFRGSLPSDKFSVGESPDLKEVAGLSEFVTPGFFDTVGISRVRGRDFTWSDGANGPQVAILSETLSRRLVPEGDPIGRRLRVTAGSKSVDVEIVGVVSDAPIGNIREPHLAVVFRPMMQNLPFAQSPMAHVRVNGDVQLVRDAYPRAVQAEGHHFVRTLFTLDDWIDFALLQERLMSAVATTAAALGVLLACLALFSALAFAVAARRREIAVRMALGASNQRVINMVIKDGLSIVVVGVLVGIPSALGGAMLLRSQLYGVASTDGTTVIASAALFFIVACAATLLPAWRASRTDPVNALREQ